MYHKVLDRQLKKFFQDLSEIPSGWAPFLQAISDAYTHNDEDRALIERSLDLSSKELTVINQKIEAEKTELVSKAKDLERMNKLMVDRELKMVELKAENERLRQQLGESTSR